MLEQTKPAIYDLSAAPDGKSLNIRVFKGAVESLRQDFSNLKSPYFLSIQKELAIPSFIPPTEKMWGFGKALTETGDENKDWLTWECKLPKGNGKFTAERWTNLYAVSATLKVLLNHMQYTEVVGASDKKQLLSVSLVSEKGLHGGSLFGVIEASLIPFIVEQSDQETCGLDNGKPLVTSLIREKMRLTHSHLWGRRNKFFDRSFRVWINYQYKKYILLSCPGNACDIGSEMFRANDDLNQGYEIGSHNCESPLQQLTLLAGLATLNEEARKAGY